MRNLKLSAGFLTSLFLIISLFPKISVSASLNSCFVSASQYYNVPYWALLGIAKVESADDYYAVNVEGRSYFPDGYRQAYKIIYSNIDKSFDVGIMQVNKMWFDKFHYPYYIGLNPCFDVYLGAYVLARKISRFGSNWQGIAAYHSADRNLNVAYAWEVYDAVK